MSSSSAIAVRDLPVSVDTRLVVDVGGTNLRIVECDLTGKSLSQERYPHPSQVFPDLTTGIATFLSRLGHRPALGVIGAAGPIAHGRTVRLTNAPAWPPFDVDEADDRVGVQFRLFNDLVVAAAAVPALSGGDVEVLRPGAGAPNGPCLVATISTGINDAVVLPPDFGPLRFLAGESGHTPFAPRDEREVDLLQWAWKERGMEFLSFESVLSGGHGFRLLYDYVLATTGLEPSDGTARSIAAGSPHPIVLSGAAVRGDDPVATQVAEMFGAVAGTFVGSRTVATVSNGGVYLVGGVSHDAPFMRLVAEQTAFLDRFASQGVQSSFVADVPIYRVTHENPGLLGATEIARHLS